MRGRRDATTELRGAIDALPVRTRFAMLEGIRANPIIVGAYTDNDGGICPMLAAHRHGGRTTFLAFARSWDRFSGARRVRRATEREVTTLESYLVRSLRAEEASGPPPEKISAPMVAAGPAEKAPAAPADDPPAGPIEKAPAGPIEEAPAVDLDKAIRDHGRLRGRRRRRATAGEEVDLGAAIADHLRLRGRYTEGRTFPEITARRLRAADAERVLAKLDMYVQAVEGDGTDRQPGAAERDAVAL